LGLTLLAPICAVALLFTVDLPAWGRAVIAMAVFVVTLIDVYFVRQSNSRAIAALSLERREADAVGDAGATAGLDPGNIGEQQQKLVLRLRYRFPARVGGVTEVEALVLPPRVLPIWADAIDAEEFRRIRVLLKWR